MLIILFLLLHQLIGQLRSDYLFAQMSTGSCFTSRLDTFFCIFQCHLMVNSDFFTRLWVFGILPSAFMILNSRELFWVFYVVFSRSLVLNFLPSNFVIIDWRVLLAAFYILLFTIRWAFGVLFSTSFNFASKMDLVAEL